jgi:hypothetical protein
LRIVVTAKDWGEQNAYAGHLTEALRYLNRKE